VWSALGLCGARSRRSRRSGCLAEGSRLAASSCRARSSITLSTLRHSVDAWCLCLRRRFGLCRGLWGRNGSPFRFPKTLLRDQRECERNGSPLPPAGSFFGSPFSRRSVGCCMPFVTKCGSATHRSARTSSRRLPATQPTAQLPNARPGAAQRYAAGYIAARRSPQNRSKSAGMPLGHCYPCRPTGTPHRNRPCH
jgi:hypothetical protein